MRGIYIRNNLELHPTDFGGSLEFAMTLLCTAARSGQGRDRQVAAISEPLLASTAVESSKAYGRPGG